VSIFKLNADSLSSLDRLSITVTSILVSFSLPSTLIAEANNALSGENMLPSVQGAGSDGSCPSWIGIGLDEASGNKTEIACIETILEGCKPFNYSLGYILGSLRISINGPTGEGACSVNMYYEIERGQSNMTCMIPLGYLPSWTNWKRGDGLDSINQIVKYCNN
jgi:hypothetical protein